MTEHLKNAQWRVTDAGLEAHQPYEYFIAAERLTERAGAGAGEFYDWPIQLAGKTWIDWRAFEEAYRFALKQHEGRYKGKVDGELLDRSIARAKEVLKDRG